MNSIGIHRHHAHAEPFKKPEAQMVKPPNDDSEHVATRLCSLNFSDRLKYITGVSAKAQVYPKFQDYLESTWIQLMKWAQ